LIHRPLLQSYDQLAAEMVRFEEERGATLAQLGAISVAQLLNESALHDLGHMRR
jgi:hypothetical protein